MAGYLCFERTGHKEVDEILWRIEQAGDGYRDTSQWDESEKGDPSYMDKINEAIRAASAVLIRRNKKRLYKRRAGKK